MVECEEYADVPLFSDCTVVKKLKGPPGRRDNPFEIGFANV